MVTPVAKREVVGHLRSAFEVSERRACTVIGADRTSVRYRARRADDEPIRVRLRELASERRRFGYRRLHVLLTREGLIVNHTERLGIEITFSREGRTGTRMIRVSTNAENSVSTVSIVSAARSHGSQADQDIFPGVRE